MQQSVDGEQKLYSQFGLFSLVFLVFFSTLYAGDFEDFKRLQHTSFVKYKDEKDSAFNNYLKQQWQEYKEQNKELLYTKPKPKEMISIKPKISKSLGPRIVIKKQIYKKPKFIIQKVKKDKDIVFDFFGLEVGFNIDTKLRDAKFYPQNKKGILNFFDLMASSEYENILLDIKSISKDLNLNDWGLYQLILKLSSKVYSNQDDANIFSWFLFNKLGYSVKIALSKRHTFLLFYSKKIIYSTPNYSFLNKKYYLLSNYAKGSVGGLYSYAQNYPKADKALDLSMKELPNFVLDIKQKVLKFSEYGKMYEIDFKYNQNLIDFMSTYPQADYKTYFNTPIDSLTYDSMLDDLKRYVDGKKATDAINFILHFVQKAFRYERDKEQFFREKVMFAQETLYFNKSDCEDRAILFANLIKKMFGIVVVGVKYKDHMADALYIPVKGDSIKINTRKFIIADPTYVGANIGQSMRKYRSIKPQSFILVN